MPRPTRAAQQRRRAVLRGRLENSSAALSTCSAPFCTRPTARASGKGLSDTLCPFHRNLLARHGSTFRRSFRAPEVRPFLLTARAHIRANATDPLIDLALSRLSGWLLSAGPLLTVPDVKGRPALFRARGILSRLREGGVTPGRLLAAHLAVSALLVEDRDAPTTDDFRVTQFGKAIHHLRSGSTWRGEIALGDGRVVPAVVSRPPNSSGAVLRRLGRELDEICAPVATRDLDAIRRAKVAKHGPHETQRPDWVPAWRRTYDAGRPHG